MIMYFWVGMILFSVVSAAVQGGMGELTSAIMQSAGDAVSLCIRLTGTICLWSGLMNIAERSGLTSAVCRLISPLLRLVFPKMDPKGETAQAISMNLTANMLGLGNAATPLGLEAMNSSNPDYGRLHAAGSRLCLALRYNARRLGHFSSLSRRGADRRDNIH